MINSNSKRVTVQEHRTEPAPSLTVQVYELLRANGFSINEAVDSATKTRTAYLSTTQRVFQFAGPVIIEIVAAKARLVSAPKGLETPHRTLENIEAQQNLEISKRARAIRERREKDERRGNR